MANEAVLKLLGALSDQTRIRHAQTRITVTEEMLLERLRDDRFPGQRPGDVLRYLLLREIAPYYRPVE